MLIVKEINKLEYQSMKLDPLIVFGWKIYEKCGKTFILQKILKPYSHTVKAIFILT